MSKLNQFLAVAATAAALPLSVQAETKLNLANEYQDSTFAAVADKFFIERVTELTGGSVAIDYFPGGSLGFKSIDHYDAVGDGAIDIADTYIGRLSGISPLFSMPSLPFLATTKGDALRLEAVLKPKYDEIFGAANQIYLFSTPWPPSGIWTRDSVATPADLAELKVRVPDVTAMQTFKAAGANPLQISWGDIVPQLSANALDAVISSAEGGTNIKLGEFLPSYAALDYVIPVNVLHMNADAFNALDADEQAAIRQAAADTSEFIWSELESRLSGTYQDLEALKIDVTRQVSPEVMQSLRDASADAMNDWLAKAGTDGQALLDSFNSGS